VRTRRIEPYTFAERTTVFTTRPELAGTFGMVTSTHWLASAAGMAVLERGGNAFDAAAAAGFTLQVVEPHLNGPLGDMPLVFARAGGRPTVLCGQGPAPAAATLDAFAGLDRIPGTGPLAACVPGSMEAWLLLLRDHGTLPLADVLQYAIGYAAGGFPLVRSIITTIEGVTETFVRDWPTSAELWLPGGRAPRPGTLFRNPALAATYRRLVEESERAGGRRERQLDAARRTWREGFVAQAVVTASRRPVRDSSGQVHAGLLTAEDLAAFEATYEEPVTTDFDGWTVCKTGPWGQGPVFGQALRVLDELGVRDLDVLGPELAHVVVEALKLAMADREAWYGDPAHVDVPLEALLSRAYARERALLVGDSASHDLRPGSPDGRTPVLAALAGAVTGAVTGPGDGPRGVGEPTVGRPGERTGETRGDTCHVDVVDRWGNLVSATPSGGWLQSSPTIPELGCPLGTRAQMFWLDPASPSVVAPGKRPRTTLSPTLLLRDDEPVIAFGTPGGDQQDQWSLLYFLRLVVGGMNLQQGVDAPAFHTTSFPSSFFPRETTPGEVVVESRAGEAVLAGLRRRGHVVTVSQPWSLGRLSAVSRDPATGILRAAANPRGMQGYAAGR
jgi:gamma-glutamyltranspeptidase/glutathione hydrolase